MMKYAAAALAILATGIAADRYLRYNGFFSNTFSCEFENEKEAGEIAASILINLPSFSKAEIRREDLSVKVEKMWASDGENTASVEFFNKTDGGKIATMYLTESECDMYVEYTK